MGILNGITTAIPAVILTLIRLVIIIREKIVNGKMYII